MNLNQKIIKDSAITTGGMSGGGLLNPEQAKQFIQQTFDATNLGSQVRHVMRTAKTGEIDKIGINARILRKKIENADDGYRAGVNTDKIEYATTAVRLPWEITEETLRENIEGQNMEKIITDLMTTQLGIDAEDLYLNGDEDIPEKYDTGKKESDGTTPIMADTPDYDFLKINDGWIKQITNDGHVIDKTGSSISLDVFYDAVQAIPNKYNNGKLAWIMSPHRRQEWERYLLNQMISAGSTAPDSLFKNPASIPVLETSRIGNDTILLTDPKNLIVVNTYGIIIRKTTEGKEAIMQDKRFYVVHFDYDPIVEELDATAIIKGLGK